jgi:hypothetical protein
MLTRKFRLLGCAALIGAACVGVGGCSTVDGDLSPEMLSLHQRNVDYHNMRAHTFDTNGRAAWADWKRLTLTDRPSRLNPVPMPH